MLKPQEDILKEYTFAQFLMCHSHTWENERIRAWSLSKQWHSQPDGYFAFLEIHPVSPFPVTPGLPLPMGIFPSSTFLSYPVYAESPWCSWPIQWLWTSILSVLEKSFCISHVIISLYSNLREIWTRGLTIWGCILFQDNNEACQGLMKSIHEPKSHHSSADMGQNIFCSASQNGACI